MTKLEILQCVVNNHNRLTQIMVSGDNAIMIGETLKEMRILVQMLKKDVEAECGEEGTEQKGGIV